MGVSERLAWLETDGPVVDLVSYCLVGIEGTFTVDHPIVISATIESGGGQECPTKPSSGCECETPTKFYRRPREVKAASLGGWAVPTLHDSDRLARCN